MDLKTIILIMTFISIAVGYVSVHMFAKLFKSDPDNPIKNGRMIQLMESTQLPEAQKVLTETDLIQIADHCSRFAWHSVIYMAATVIAVAINFIMLLLDSNGIKPGPITLGLFGITNAWVIAFINLPWKADRFVTHAENRILSLVMTNKAADHAGKGFAVVDADDIVSWLNAESEKLAQEMRELGLDPDDNDIDDADLDAKIAALEEVLEENDKNQ